MLLRWKTGLAPRTEERVSVGCCSPRMLPTGRENVSPSAMLVLFIWHVRLLMKYKDAFEVASGLSRGDVSVEPVLHD